MRRLAALALAVTLVVAVGACTGSTGVQGGGRTSSAEPTASPLAIPKVARGGAPTAAAAIRKRCVPPATPSHSPTPSPAANGSSAAIVQIETQVEQARGLAFLHPVRVEQVSDAEMDRQILESFDASYPRDLYARRSVAWATIGVIPQGTDLRAALRTFFTGQVVGYYDPATKRLVVLGDGGNLGLMERMVIAHELTHALDDQHFNLSRLDRLTATCQDERFTAALGAVEGDAQYTSTKVITEDPTLDLGDLAQALQDALAADTSTAGVPTFLQNLETWPYTAGQAFMTQRALTGGTAALDRTLRDLPTSTEEVMHPDLYPGGTPATVDVPDLTPELGPAWGDLDAMQVGEEWLTEMLALRLDRTTAADAAAGWNGGVYRAFTDGTHVVVVLATAWDTTSDAAAFAKAASTWLGGDGVVRRHGDRVDVVFASDPGSLRHGAAALASSS